MKTLARLALVLTAAGIAGLAFSSVWADTDTMPDDYCYRTIIAIENNTGGTLADYGVRVAINAAGMVHLGHLDARGWDIKPTTGGFSNEPEVQTQDLDSATAPWWFYIDSLASGSVQTFRVYSGNVEQKRDSGVFLTGNDQAVAATHADFDITDDLALEVELELEDDSAVRTGTLVSRWDANAGYRLQLADNGGQVIRFQVDDQVLDSAWNPAWSDETIDIRAVFQAPDMTIYVDGVQIDTVNSGLGAATATSTNAVIGTDLTYSTIRDVAIHDNVGGTEAVVAHWTFNPGVTGAVGCSETGASDPTYQGVCQDVGGNNHDLTYTFSRSQTGIGVTVGATGLTSAPQSVVQDTSLPDILGDPFTDDLFNSSLSENSHFFGYEFALPLVADTGIPRQMGWSIVLGAFGLILMIGTWGVTRNVLFSLAAAVIPPFVGVLNNWIEPWVIVVWVFAAVLIFGTHKWVESS